jgi:spore maturation protein CgeB
MRVVMFYHSLLSDWNHGNAHFLRGIVSEMLARGIKVDVYEPRGAWSVQNLMREHGDKPITDFYSVYPGLDSIRYDPHKLDLKRALADADVVIVHEWNKPDVVAMIGEHRRTNDTFQLFFHDTHHRAITAPNELEKYDLTNYDGVLAFGRVIRDVYLKRDWAKHAWTWHEAADTRVFYPRTKSQRLPRYDLIWIGNWGDEERSAELLEYLIDPIKDLGLRAKVHGVRYPAEAKRALDRAGIEYAGWLPNFAAPQSFAQATLTVHVPRRPYTRNLPGIPTIRPFEALACGIPLASSYWNDAEHLFAPGKDFLIAESGHQMKEHIKQLLVDSDLRRSLVQHGLKTIRERHTCAHRVDELMEICSEVKRSKTKRVMFA